MPNPYYFRTVVDRLWRIANGTHSGDVSVRTVNNLIKAFPPDIPRYVAAQQMLDAVDAYDYARHLLRDLYDRTQTGGSSCPPLPLGEGWGEGSPVPLEEEPPDEDDDPL